MTSAYTHQVRTDSSDMVRTHLYLFMYKLLADEFQLTGKPNMEAGAFAASRARR